MQWLLSCLARKEIPLDTPVSSDLLCYQEGGITKIEAPQFRAQSERAGWTGICWLGRWEEDKGFPGLCKRQEVSVAKEQEGDVRPDAEVPVYQESIWAQLWVPEGIWGSFNRGKM